ncbi:hypothetical protein OG21DRAFT_1521398 [Imleria badia]|nr:hypothetical protein OG21DRAFT_1521398 [Imleria badia]
MPPARLRPLMALGSLQLIGYANNPTRVITEFAFIADGQVNALEEGGRGDINTPLEVRFEEFMNGVNSRGRVSWRYRVGKTPLFSKGNAPYKERGMKYDFFDFVNFTHVLRQLMAFLLQSYQEKRELDLKCQTQSRVTKTLAIQTSLATIDGSSYTGTATGRNAPRVHPVVSTSMVEIPTQSNSQSGFDLPNNDFVVDTEPTSVASEVDPDLDNGDNHDLVSGPETEPVQLVACTPVAPRSFNPYMTPISNPRHVDHTAATPSSLNASPTPVTNSHTEITPNEEDVTDEGIGELLQATATSQGRLSYYYDKFVAACQKAGTVLFVGVALHGQKEAIQRDFDVTKRKLDETEQCLREANADRWKLKKWVAKLRGRLDSIYKQLGLLREISDPEAIDDEEWSVYNPESPSGL